MTSADSIAIADHNGHFLFLQDLLLQDAAKPIYSLTKPYIAAAILAARIDPASRVSKWIDKSVLPAADRISVAQLLNHSSGLTDYGALPAYQLAVRGDTAAWSDETFARHTLQQPLLFEPGDAFAYSNPGYWLLGQILQRESNLSFDGAMHRFVLDPLGLTNTHVAQGIFASDLPDYPAEWVWHGLLISTAQDVVRFMMSDMTTAKGPATALRVFTSPTAV